MNLNITTKFNVGDKVYVADAYYENWHPDKTPHRISEVIIKIFDKVRISYRIDRYTYEESTCFSSYEECAEWCQSKNTK